MATRVAFAALIVASAVLQTAPAYAADGDPISITSTVTTVVDPSFSFTVSGKNSGSCNGATITGTGSTATAISLGRVDKTTSAVGGQQLSVGSNAGGGFTVFAHVDGPLRDDSGHSISALGSTPSGPSAFVNPGTEAFGYTTDSLLSGAVPDRFVNGGKWAGIDTNDREVMYSSTANSGASNCVAYQITISNDTVGGYYGANVIYTAVPSF